VSVVFFAKRFPLLFDCAQFLLAREEERALEKVTRDLVKKSRIRIGRKPDPSYRCIDF
jgi:hypothetical protein